MRDAFKYLTSVLFVAVVVQVALAGYGAFNAVSKAECGVGVEAVLDSFLRRLAVVGLADRVEGAVAGERHLRDDRREED